MSAQAPTSTCTVLGGTGDRREFAVRRGQTVLDAMPKSPDAPIRVGCRGGGCGVCRVRVLEGEYATKRMSRRFVTEADEATSVALACRLLPTGDLVVRWEPPPPADPSAR
jgi:ferredoxin